MEVPVRDGKSHTDFHGVRHLKTEYIRFGPYRMMSSLSDGGLFFCVSCLCQPIRSKATGWRHGKGTSGGGYNVEVTLKVRELV